MEDGMATFRYRNKKWQARVQRQGHAAISKSFLNKQDAEKWARSIELGIDRGAYLGKNPAERTTLAEIIQDYIREVTPGMRSAKADTIRLTAMLRDPVCRLNMLQLTPRLIAEYRDRRLKSVTPGTVIRELSYLSSIINHARREGGLNIQNPVQLVRKPQNPQGRTRVLDDAEEQRLLDALIATRSNRRNPWMKPLVELALATAMRRGELLSLTWKNIDFKRRVVYLPMTKNGSARHVPLSSQAVAILDRLPHHIDGRVFPINDFSVAAAFMKATKCAGVEDFRFHDLRHTAITRLAGKLSNVLELSALSGHKSLSMLKRYTHIKPEDLARKLG